MHVNEKTSQVSAFFPQADIGVEHNEQNLSDSELSSGCEAWHINSRMLREVSLQAWPCKGPEQEIPETSQTLSGRTWWESPPLFIRNALFREKESPRNLLPVVGGENSGETRHEDTSILQGRNRSRRHQLSQGSHCLFRP